MLYKCVQFVLIQCAYTQIDGLFQFTYMDTPMYCTFLNYSYYLYLHVNMQRQYGHMFLYFMVAFLHVESQWMIQIED